ncbi:MAG: heat-inducible transcriptional repressor HrcA [Candidatus Omnitrophota bacterium]|nr:heat-inducible transcriptional repressor HrcA [Candidatus Omnitrophota bacterium]
MDKKSREERKYSVLRHIVHSYIYAANPVSSKTVSQDMGNLISSATVRNIMAELEDEGYIEQPHTSAGRIPTTIGYRRYVENISARIQLKKEEAQRLASEYDRHINTLKEVIEKTSFLLSRQLNSAGIVMWPSIGHLYLKHIELIKIKAEIVLAVLVTMTNAVKNYMVNLEKDLGKPELSRISNYINRSYENFSLSEISEKIKAKADDPGSEGLGGIEGSTRIIIDAILKENSESEVCCDGVSNFMYYEGTRDMDAIKSLIHLFSERKDMTHIMRKEMPDGSLKIYIGDDSGCEALNKYSVITRGYSMHGRTAGRLGVIGPMRMDYARALETIEYLSDVMSGKLEEING